MTMELGGKVTIACEKNNLQAQLDFKLKVLYAACGRQCMELRRGGLVPSFCTSALNKNNPGVDFFASPEDRQAQREKGVAPGHTAEPEGLSPNVLMVADCRFESRLRERRHLFLVVSLV